MSLRVITHQPRVSLRTVFARRVGRTAVGCSQRAFARGRDALFAAYSGLRSSRHETMWLPAFHCGVEVQAALGAGFEVDFYRVSRELLPDLAHLAAGVRRKPGPVTVIHYFGHTCAHTDAVADLCRDSGVPLVEDACHGPFGRGGGPRKGSRGVAVAFSLRKVLGTPDGGVLALSDAGRDGSKPLPPAVAEAPGRRTLRPMAELLGRKLRLWNPLPEDMDPIDPQASPCYGRAISLLSERFRYCSDPDHVFVARRANWRALVRRLETVEGFHPIASGLDDEAVPLSLAIRVERREGLMGELIARGIDSYVFGRHPHPAMPLQQFPETVEMRSRILGIPVHHALAVSEIDRIAAALTRLLPTHRCTGL